MCMDREELGERMLNWHSSMSDPIYAVGSFYIDGQVYPKSDIVRDALHNLTKDLEQSKRMLAGEKVMVERGGKQVDLKVFAGYTSTTLSEMVADLSEITLYLGQYLEEDYTEVDCGQA